MTLKQAAWKRQDDNEYSEWDSLHEYPLANLNLKPERKRRINNTTIFCAVTLVVWALAMIF